MLILSFSLARSFQDDYVGLLKFSLSTLDPLPCIHTLSKTQSSAYDGEGQLIINNITRTIGSKAPGGLMLKESGMEPGDLAKPKEGAFGARLARFWGLDHADVGEGKVGK